jgi:A/G-specific adenine glycosylase
MSTTTFASHLLSWYTQHKRDLPWRSTQEPYIIWISEVILQQTRVAQGLPYFHRFIEAFPTVKALAAATEEKVLSVWEGLGYYSRARNLHQGSQYVLNECNGIFPHDYAGLLKVKGIGPYTAAAIASICFGEVTPVIDGNVYRVASRFFGIHDDISRPASRKVFASTLGEMMSRQCPGDFNQAIMELGAMVCTPQSPKCLECPIAIECVARNKGLINSLPVKSKKVKSRDRYFHYMVIQYDDKLALQKRKEGDVWQGLYQFHLEETGMVNEEPSFLKFSPQGALLTRSKQYRHLLTHQKIFARFYKIDILDEDFFKNLLDECHLTAFSVTDIVDLPKPKLIVNYLTEHIY